ncbi:hypothetical protein BGZ60DRAFT_414823 [Tricladium varicosporioides]|nr:hypothetical protein BGZ60DRAFT_414823 [Hymenoscyphus varicosporioides]
MSIQFIQPLAPRASDELISPGDWLSQITLCLAPLIVHIIIGVPSTVYLHRKQPRWYDEICFYNPTSIIWRYMVILERRVRAKNWKSIDMAASTVRFWTADGWDGSEDIMEKSRPFCTRIPHHARINFVSKTAFETLVIFLQCIQAMVDLAQGDQGGWQVSISNIFYPLALIGVVRLPAAYWLSDDHSYTNVHSEETERLLVTTSLEERAEFTLRMAKTSALLGHGDHGKPYDAHPRNGWRARLVRGFYLVVLIGLAATSFRYVAPFSRFITLSVTAYIEALLYCFTLFSTITICGFYVFKHKTDTTIIPCIQSTWYKIHTGFVFLAAITVFCLAAIETRKEPCGIFTTYQGNTFANCRNGLYLSSRVMEDPIDKTIRTPTSNDHPDHVYLNGFYQGVSRENGTSIELKAFTGWCKGKMNANATIQISGQPMSNETEWIRALGQPPNVVVTEAVLEKEIEATGPFISIVM